MKSQTNTIKITNAREHNLKSVSLELPRNQLIVFTGLSGSGKSSLAFDTIFAEGQRRYMESLSSYARQFLNKMDKPDVDSIEGLSPAISIDQKSASHNPRSTVGTITEIYDHLRLLFASIGEPHCPKTGKPLQRLSVQEMSNVVEKSFAGQQVTVMAPLVEDKKGEFKSLFETLIKDGFSRVRVDGKILRLSNEIALEKNNRHNIELVVDRIAVEPDNKDRLFESIETAVSQSQGFVLFENAKNEKLFLSERYFSPDYPISYSEINHRLFSFNSPLGACTECNGLGDILDFDPDLVIQFPELSVRKCTGKVLNLDNTYYGKSAEKLAKKHHFSLDDIFEKLTVKQKNILLYGSEKAQEENPFLKTSQDDVPEYEGVFGDWEGIMTNLRRRYKQTQSEGMRHYFKSFMTANPCKACGGGRLKPECLSITIKKKSIFDITNMTIEQSLDFFQSLKLTESQEEITRQIRKEIVERLSFMKNVGLDYLDLTRKAGTLSGGEFQRIRLATQIGVGLTGVLYVLDEPSIGLHQRDNLKLIQTLLRLRDLGNTLIVVEHDEDTMRQSDYIVDIGPGAGIKGGTILFSGTPKAMLKSKKSLTAKYLNGEETIPIPKKRRTFKNQKFLEVVGATENNLKNISVKFPLGKLCCITGVSGSGKSTLMNGIMHKALMRHFYKSKERPGTYKALKGLDHVDKVITIDQSPIGRTPRSNPATYTGVFSPIRDLFAVTREAKIRGYKAGRFSFNVKGGRCEACEGDGLVKIEMHFLSDVYVTCEVCKGKRYNDQTLQVKYKGHTISDILSMTVAEALDVFENIPSIKNKLQTLQDVGLDYIHLGQNATTLSGGEAQRIKLAKELSKKSTGDTIYLLDEPTTGLHFEDIKKLLRVMNRLVDGGNTVLVIEHNLDVIKTADHIIDLGPEGGSGGGMIVAEGTPEKVAKVKASFTGQFLGKILL